MVSAGKVIYRLYHQPLGYLGRTLRTGIGKTLAIHRGKREMMQAATGLREFVYPGRDTYTVYFLTGKRYWYQTAFCLYSLQRQAECNVCAVLVDDGSFDQEQTAQIQRQFPTTVNIVCQGEIERHLNERLPVSAFPVLRARRTEYPHLRKLTDVHALPGSGPKLVLDSDMLFFRHPKELVEWLKKPNGFLFMRDAEQSYGYDEALMCKLAGVSAMPVRLNVGVAGMASEKIDWPSLEEWTKQMLEQAGSSYLQEQALTAMLAACFPHNFLDASLYKVLPAITGSEVNECLHHYVAESKYDYFVKGWRMVAKG